MKASDKLRKINPADPETDIIAEAARIISNGGVVVFPTRGLYGLGADAFNDEAVSRIFHIKQRPENKPILVLIKNKDKLDRFVEHIPQAASVIMERFWPGKVSIVFKAKKGFPVNLTSGTGRIGIRVPEHNVAFALVNAVGNPITGTSANLSGSTGCSHIDYLEPKIANRVDLILDAGPLKGSAGSTVVDITSGKPLILRQGELSQKDILNAIDNFSMF